MIGAAGAAMMLPLSACMTDQADPPPAAPPATTAPAVPTPSPTAAPDGTIALATPHPITVLEKESRGDGPQLCVGGVAASLPPQCTGVDLLGWSWEDVAGEYDDRSGVRWGEFVVTGDFSLSDDTMRVTLVETDGPDRGPRWPDCADECEQPTEEQEAIAGEIIRDHVGIYSSGVDGTGAVRVEVAYDDGSLQRELDATYGEGVVIVESILLPVEE